MTDVQALFTQMYAAFNHRDIDACLATMSDQIDWPKASEGGRVVGKDAIRAYWTRQWAEFDPIVDPIRITQRDSGEVEVEVHQVVRTLSGKLLADDTVFHLYQLANGLIQRMDLGSASEAGPTSAFRHHQTA